MVDSITTSPWPDLRKLLKPRHQDHVLYLVCLQRPETKWWKKEIKHAILLAGQVMNTIEKILWECRMHPRHENSRSGFIESVYEEYWIMQQKISKDISTELKHGETIYDRHTALENCCCKLKWILWKRSLNFHMNVNENIHCTIFVSDQCYGNEVCINLHCMTTIYIQQS